ncbi:MAG TPA: hypothetical protein VND24_00815 [Steroidobacteraceae bacterium]|nr:hypothetical protein [Steroidobacteraceae bacterium]
MSPPTRGARSAAPVNPGSDLACAAATAASLIELAIRESQRPVTELGEALARVSATAAAGSPPAPGDLDSCVKCLQFHDRMVQQLGQVRDLLAALAVPGSADTGGRQSWPALVESLRGRFTSESHRILFNLLMANAQSRGHRPSLHAGEGSVELF